VFKGPVAWTGKKTGTQPDPTDCNRTAGCGCSLSNRLRLPVALNQKYLKTGKKPVAIGCNRFIIVYIISTYIHTFTPVITIYMNNKLIKVSIIIIITQINGKAAISWVLIYPCGCARTMVMWFSEFSHFTVGCCLLAISHATTTTNQHNTYRR
jgi:hypothetical protein